MPAPLQDRVFEPVDERLIADFDLERLARISEAQPEIEPPRFTLLEPAPRIRIGRTAVAGLLSAVVVLLMLNLRPAAAASYGAAPSSATSGSCPIAN
jgi:hypothetical protein